MRHATVRLEVVTDEDELARLRALLEHGSLRDAVEAQLPVHGWRIDQPDALRVLIDEATAAVKAVTARHPERSDVPDRFESYDEYDEALDVALEKFYNAVSSDEETVL